MSYYNYYRPQQYVTDPSLPTQVSQHQQNPFHGQHIYHQPQSQFISQPQVFHQAQSVHQPPSVVHQVAGQQHSLSQQSTAYATAHHHYTHQQPAVNVHTHQYAYQVPNPSLNVLQQVQTQVPATRIAQTVQPTAAGQQVIPLAVPSKDITSKDITSKGPLQKTSSSKAIPIVDAKSGKVIDLTKEGLEQQIDQPLDRKWRASDDWKDKKKVVNEQKIVPLESKGYPIDDLDGNKKEITDVIATNPTEAKDGNLQSSTASSSESTPTKVSQEQDSVKKCESILSRSSSRSNSYSPGDFNLEDEADAIYWKFAYILAEEGPLEPTNQKMLGQFINLSTTERKKVMAEGSIKSFLIKCPYIELQGNLLVLKEMPPNARDKLLTEESNVTVQDISLPIKKIKDDFEDDIGNSLRDAPVEKFESKMLKHGISVKCPSSMNEKSSDDGKVSSLIEKLYDLPLDDSDAETGKIKNIDGCTTVTEKKLNKSESSLAELDELVTGMLDDSRSVACITIEPKSDGDTDDVPSNWGACWSSKSVLTNVPDTNVQKTDCYEINQDTTLKRKRKNSLITFAAKSSTSYENRNNSNGNVQIENLEVTPKSHLCENRNEGSPSRLLVNSPEFVPRNKSETGVKLSVTSLEFVPKVSFPQFGVPKVSLPQPTFQNEPVPVSSASSTSQEFQRRHCDHLASIKSVAGQHSSKVIGTKELVTQTKPTFSGYCENVVESKTSVTTRGFPPLRNIPFVTSTMPVNSSNIPVSSSNIRPLMGIIPFPGVPGLNSIPCPTWSSASRDNEQTKKCTTGINTTVVSVKEFGVQSEAAMEMHEVCVNTIESIFDPSSEYSMPIVHTQDISTDMPEKSTNTRNTQTGNTWKNLSRDKSCQVELEDVLKEMVCKQTNKNTCIEEKINMLHKNMNSAVCDLKYRLIGVVQELTMVSEISYLRSEEREKLFEQLNSVKEEIQCETDRIGDEYIKLMKDVKNGKQISAEETVLKYLVPSIPQVICQMNGESRSQMDLITSILETIPINESKVLELMGKSLKTTDYTSTQFRKNFIEMEYKNARYRLRMKYIAIYENYILLTERGDKCVSCSERNPLLKDFDRVTLSYKSSVKHLKDIYDNNIKKLEEGSSLKDLPAMIFTIPACPSTFIIPAEENTSTVDTVFENLYKNIATLLDKEFPVKPAEEIPSKPVEEILLEINAIDSKKNSKSKTEKKTKKAKRKCVKNSQTSNAIISPEVEPGTQKPQTSDKTNMSDKNNEVPDDWEERASESTPGRPKENEKRSAVENQITGENKSDTNSGMESTESECSRSENSTPGLSSNDVPNTDPAIMMQQYQPLLNSMMMSLMQSNPALMFNPQLLQSMAMQHLMIMLNNNNPNNPSQTFGGGGDNNGNPMFQNMFRNIFGGNTVGAGMNMNNVNQTSTDHTKIKSDKTSEKDVSTSKPTLPPGMDVNNIEDLSTEKKLKKNCMKGNFSGTSDEVFPAGKKTKNVTEAIVGGITKKSSKSKKTKRKTTKMSKETQKSDTVYPQADEFRPAMNVGNLNFSGKSEEVSFIGSKSEHCLSAATVPNKDGANTCTKVQEPVVKPKTHQWFPKVRRGSEDSLSSVDSWDTVPSRLSRQEKHLQASSSRSSPYESANSSLDQKPVHGKSLYEDWNEEVDPYAGTFQLQSFNTHAQILAQTEKKIDKPTTTIPVSMPSQRGSWTDKFEKNTAKVQPKNLSSRSVLSSSAPNNDFMPTYIKQQSQESKPPLNQFRSTVRSRAVSGGNIGSNKAWSSWSSVNKAIPVVGSSIKTVPVNVVCTDKKQTIGPVPITPLMSTNFESKNANADVTNPLISLGKTTKKTPPQQSYKETNKVSEMSTIEGSNAKEESAKEEVWHEVGKKGKKRENSGPVIDLTLRKAVPENRLENLIMKMKENEQFANLGRSDIIDLIEQVRKKIGSFKGMSFAEVTRVAESIHSENARKKVDYVHYAHDGTVDQLKTLLYKSEICQYWLKGACAKRNSEDCVYAHGKEELLPGGKGMLCPSVKKGENCLFGEKCVFSHSKPQVQISSRSRSSTVPTAIPSVQWGPTEKKAYDIVHSDEEPNAEHCSICLENIRTGYVNRLDCGHGFHDGCIKDWINKRQMTCPVCRKYSLLVEDFPKLGI